MSKAMKVSKARMKGDPGLFGVIGSVLGGVAKTVGGLLPGPVGGAVTKIGGVISGGGAGLPAPLPGKILTSGVTGGIVGGAVGNLVGGAVAMPGTGAVSCGPGALKIGGKCVSPGDVFPGGANFIYPAGGSAAACPKGYHPNKTSYFLKDGTFVPVASRCVRNRRRNPGNMKALSRSMARLDSAKRLQHKLAGYSTAKYTGAGKRKACGCK